ncbi:unnamed protein product [Rhizoctonia solani]|uniref:Uncharacterized protein n=1 Tax=Rhizoctonia solani TaxID=456999 RepID=A0A8H2WJ68_9AGAM|nr:unnamed protein product [Rhizoctonia solani]
MADIMGTVSNAYTSEILLMIVDGYAIPGTLGVMAKVAVGITAKFFALSLMINLVGQGHVRDKFNDFHLTPPTISSNRPTGVISEAVFAHDIVTVHSYIDVEHRRSTSDAESTRFGSLDAHHKQDEQEGIVEKHEVPTTPPPGSQPYHGTQHISFSP